MKKYILFCLLALTSVLPLSTEETLPVKEDLYLFSAGLGFPFFACLKYDFLPSLSVEARFMTGDMGYLASGRLYWDVLEVKKIRMKFFTGMECGYLGFYALKARGLEPAGIVGARYFFTKRYFASLDVQPLYFKFNEKVPEAPLEGLEVLFSVGISYYLF